MPTRGKATSGVLSRRGPERPGGTWTCRAPPRRRPLPSPGVEAEPRVGVRVQRPQRRRQLVPTRSSLPAMLRPASSPGPCAYSSRTRPQARPRERPQVRPHRVHVLVDPELLLVLLLRVRAAPVGRPRALVQRRRRCRRGASRARARRPSRRGRARGGASRRRTRRRSCRRRTGAARRRPGRAGTGRRAPRRTARGRARSAGRRRGRRRRTRTRAARDAARPSSSPRRSRARGRPGGRSGRAGAAKPCSVAAQARSSQPRSRLRNGSAASTSVVGARTSPAHGRAAATPASSRSFASMPGADGSSRRRMPSTALVAAAAGAAGERRGECPAAGGADDEARDLGGGARHAAPGRGAAWVPRLTRPAPAARPAPARPPASAGGGP